MNTLQDFMEAAAKTVKDIQQSANRAAKLKAAIATVRLDGLEAAERAEDDHSEH